VTRLRLAGADTFRSFRHRNFRVYFWGQAVSQIGTWLQFIAQTLLVLRLEGTATALGLLTALQFLPVLLLGPFAGLVADRFDKRHIMYVTQSVMILPALVLGVLTVTGHITTLGVFVLATVAGIGNTFDNPPRRVILSELVDESDVPNAVSLNSTLMTGARLVAPAFAAGLIATVGIGWCFIVNALSFIGGLIAVRMLDTSKMHAVPSVPRSKHQVRDGLSYLWSDRELRLAMTMMAVVSTLAFNWQVVLPIFARSTLGGSEGSYLFLSVGLSIGSLVGALAVARRRTITLVQVTKMGLGAGLSMLVLAAAPSLGVAFVVGLAAGGFAIAYLSSTASLLQVRATPAMRGRVMALQAVVFLGSTPIGGPLAGWVTQQHGARVGLLLGAIPTLVAGAATWWAIRRTPIETPDETLAAVGADGLLPVAA